MKIPQTSNWVFAEVAAEKAGSGLAAQTKVEQRRRARKKRALTRAISPICFKFVLYKGKIE